jgi:hypothetical protein
MATAETKQQVTLELSEEQRSAIEALFAYNNWDLIVVSEKTIPGPIRTSEDACTSSSRMECDALVGQTAGNEDSDRSDGQGDGGDGSYSDQELGEGQCQFCLCSPCITQNRQAWLGHGQNARPANNLIRKDKYKKFWKLLDTRGTWQHPRYIHRKRNALSRHNDHDVWTLREIMPSCVLDLVRSLYPNPEGVPYMGHKWN